MQMQENELGFNLEMSFLCLVKDDIHTKKGPGLPAKTAAKIICFGGGDLLRVFFNEGIKFNRKNYFLCDSNERMLAEDMDTPDLLSNCYPPTKLPRY